MAKKTSKKTNGKGHKNGNGAGLGREGTITRFFQDRIIAGDENAQVVKKAVAKFPKAKISKGYASWYRSQLKREGLISARA
jgi:hypothetical protein